MAVVRADTPHTEAVEGRDLGQAMPIPEGVLSGA